MKVLTKTGHTIVTWGKWLSWRIIPVLLLAILVLMRMAGVFDRIQGVMPRAEVRVVPTYTPTPLTETVEQVAPAANETLNEAASSIAGDVASRAAGSVAQDAANSATDGAAVVATAPAALTVIPLPTPTPFASPTPTSPPTPIPSPTPTPLTQDRLALGMQLHRLGDYAGARNHYATLLADETADRSLRVQTQYELVKSYLAEGYYTEALTSLDQLQNEFALTIAPSQEMPSSAADELQNKAHYLRAAALDGLGRPAEAVAAYGLFLTAYPWMESAVQPRIAQSYLAMGDTANAAGAYRRAADASADTVVRVLMLEALANVHNQAGRYSDAVAAYDEILAIAKNAGYRAQIQFQAGQSFMTGGDAAGAIQRWQETMAEAPTSRYAYQALIELVNRQVDVDLYLRGYVDLAAQAWLPAITAYQAYIDSVAPTDGRYGLALHGLGQAYIGAGDNASAISTLNRVIAEFATCECFGQAWLDLARAQAAMGDSVGAHRTYRTFARDQAANALAPEALWLSGLLALNQGNQIEAAVDFLALADGFASSPRAPLALYVLGTGAYQRGLYGQSIEMYSRLQRAYPDYRWDAVAYWLGRAYQAQGDAAQANAQWQALVNRAPDIYYGVLAAQSLRQFVLADGSMLANVQLISGPKTRVAGDDGSQAFAEQWLANWLTLDPATLAVLPQTIAEDVDLSLGRMLIDLDNRPDGLAALGRVYERNKDNTQALYTLSLEFERLEAYRLSLMAMARLLQLSPAGLVENAPIFLQERVYPRRFADLITQEALANNLDPLLMFSLIRQESLFEEGARSVAAAQGLAQIIPETGAWIAEQLGYHGFDNSLIYRPVINVRFGAYYLDWVRGYLDGNLVSALVGYNAGPGNSRHWRELSGADDTLFVEILDINEPRIYVQAVMTNLYHYTRLYGGG
jgi:soluble lytic murein transglycosylase